MFNGVNTQGLGLTSPSLTWDFIKRLKDNTRMKVWGMTAQLTEERFAAVDKLAAFASERSVSLLDVALGGLAAMPAVTSVIAGATTPEQLRANVAATAWQPDASDLEALRGI